MRISDKRLLLSPSLLKSPNILEELELNEGDPEHNGLSEETHNDGDQSDDGLDVLEIRLLLQLLDDQVVVAHPKDEIQDEHHHAVDYLEDRVKGEVSTSEALLRIVDAKADPGEGIEPNALNNQDDLAEAQRIEVFGSWKNSSHYTLNYLACIDLLLSIT